MIIYPLDLQMSHYYHRHYDPSLGRYIESDPIGLAGGLNTYLYVEGDPLLYFDPDGLKLECFYYINTGRLKCDGTDKNGKPVHFLVQCSSGHGPWRDLPGGTRRRDEGAVPAGDYELGPMKKGKLRIPLIPNPHNDMLDQGYKLTKDEDGNTKVTRSKVRDRDALQIHNDAGKPNESSDGCIVCPNNKNVPGKVKAAGGGDLYVRPYEED
jgi:uncharacterized protein RhaS with RHS repeats